MQRYLVETYTSKAGEQTVPDAVSRARAAAEEVSREGTPVHFLRSIFVPEDETCFYLYEAASARAVREATRRAAIAFERVLIAEERGIREEAK